MMVLSSRAACLLRLHPIIKCSNNGSSKAAGAAACSVLRYTSSNDDRDYAAATALLSRRRQPAPPPPPRPLCHGQRQHFDRYAALTALASSRGVSTWRGFSSASRQQSQRSALTTKLSLSGGMINLTLPLPSLPGLTNVSIPADAPVRRLVGELKALDSSLSDVDVANADGYKLAQSTPVGDMADRGLLISLDGRPRIRVTNEESRHLASEALPAEPYAALKTEIVSAGRIALTRKEFDGLCTKTFSDGGASPAAEVSTVDPLHTETWLNALVEDGLVFTADKGRVILLNPSGPGISNEIATALRGDDEIIDAKVSMLRDKLDDMYAEDRRLQGIRDTLIASVYRNVTLKKGAVLTFMVAQFTGLAYCVYEVYSWDVMEPATYFLMLSYSVGSSLYFAANNREASYNNLMDEALKRREAKLKPALGYSRSGHERLKHEIARFEEAMKLLSSHRDAHPPVEPEG